MMIDIETAAQLLNNNDIVAFPTETVYGLGALATSKEGVEKIFAIKKRPQENPLVCHFASASQIKQYTTNLPNYRDVLVSHFSPGAISYILPCADDRLTHATRGRDRVLCYIPNHPSALQLIEQVGTPIAGPSANPSKQPSATNASMVQDYFGDTVPVINGGESFIGIESTIVDCTDEGKITIFRPGQISASDIEMVLYRAGYHIPVYIGNAVQTHDTTPGDRHRHYASQTLIYKVQQRNAIHDRGDIAIIAPTEILQQIKTTEVTHRIDLGSIYTPSIIAHNLYKKLHELDTLKVRHAYCIMRNLGPSNIERAIADRLDKIGERRQE